MQLQVPLLSTKTNLVQGDIQCIQHVAIEHVKYPLKLYYWHLVQVLQVCLDPAPVR